MSLESHRKKDTTPLASELREGFLRLERGRSTQATLTDVRRTHCGTHIRYRWCIILVEDLRELALADAGQLDLNLQPTDVAQVINHTVDTLALAAEAQEVSLSTKLPDDLVPVQADADRLAQVLRNLLVNALRHTRSGGSFTVSAGAKVEALEIAVADTGEGIAADDLPHVFDRFWRADPARARSEDGREQRLADGTGLGLPVAQSLVAAQGGRIWVESTLGQGTAFRFTLPRVRHARGIDTDSPDNSSACDTYVPAVFPKGRTVLPDMRYV